MFPKGVVLVCLTVPLFSQVPSFDRDYYRNNRQRLDIYLYRTYTDPVLFGWLLIDSAKDTWTKDPHEWNRSAESYSYRVASGWGRQIVRNTVQLGFETLLHEDSRYRPSVERGVGRRALFALRSAVVAYKRDGSVEPAYGRIAAGAVAAAASSTWHPQSINATTMLWGVGQSAIDRTGNNLLAEFEPDLKRFGKKTWTKVFRK